MNIIDQVKPKVLKVVRPPYLFLQVLFKRALPIVTFAVMFIILATMIDRWYVERQPASDFVNYYSFTVNNARAGEDVFFQVCRTHDKNYRYNGNLSVNVYRNADLTKDPVKVYSRDLGGVLNTGNCENKVLRASDFRHDAGTYKMNFCIDFNVKYNINKQSCKDSNIYKIYPVPQDVEAQIKYYQEQIELLEMQLQESGIPAPQDQPSQEPTDFRAEDQSSADSGSSQPQPSNRPSTSNPDPDPEPQPEPEPEEPEPCRIGLLGLCLIR